MRLNKKVPKWLLKLGDDIIDFSESNVVYINGSPTDLIITSNDSVDSILSKVKSYKFNRAMSSLNNLMNINLPNHIHYNLTKIKDYLKSNA